jgi:hypothetical protein
MAISNWVVWGNAIYYDGDEAWTWIFNSKVNHFGLPMNDSKFYFVVVLIVTLLGNIYSLFLQYYVSILMLSASIAVLNIVRQADHLFGGQGCFNLKKVQAKSLNRTINDCFIYL